MCQENQQAAANNGMATISVANSNLDGTGTIVNVLSAGNVSNARGTTVTTVSVKATGTTSLGMVRLFINDGQSSYLYREIMVPANIQTGVVKAFSITINDIILLKPGYSLMASTENAQSFNVLANGTDWLNCDC